MKDSFLKNTPSQCGLALILLVLTLFSSAVGAQEATAPKAKADSAAKSSGSPAEPFNIGEFTMTFGGRFETKISETGELAFMKFKENVKLRSDQLDIDCNILNVDSKQVMTALGMPVKFRNKDIEGECQKLVYEPVEGKFVLTGNPHFKLSQGGKHISMKGKTITLIKDGDDTLMFIDAEKDKLGMITTEKNPASINIPDIGDLTAPKATPKAPAKTPKKPVPLSTAKKKTNTPKKLPAVSN